VSPPRFFDTNILLYSISRNPAEKEKRERSVQLLDDDNGAVSVQVLQEFYVQATRITRPDPLSHTLAAALIDSWMRFEVQEITLPILTAALEIKAAHGFSYWDSAIIAAARALGCRDLYSEDMSHGRIVEGVAIIDPFRRSDHL
jgi:predicted nucleic acid-binding protein